MRLFSGPRAGGRVAHGFPAAERAIRACFVALPRFVLPSPSGLFFSGLEDTGVLHHCARQHDTAFLRTSQLYCLMQSAKTHENAQNRAPTRVRLMRRPQFRWFVHLSRTSPLRSLLPCRLRKRVSGLPLFPPLSLRCLCLTDLGFLYPIVNIALKPRERFLNRDPLPVVPAICSHALSRFLP